MSVELLKEFIAEVMNQNVIRKLVTFIKPASRFAPGEDVDTQLDHNGNAIVDDIEKWEPDFEKSHRKATKKSRHSRKRHRVA